MLNFFSKVFTELNLKVPPCAIAGLCLGDSFFFVVENEFIVNIKLNILKNYAWNNTSKNNLKYNNLNLTRKKLIYDRRYFI